MIYSNIVKGDIVKVLYIGFKGKNNSSCRLLDKIFGAKVYLTNSFGGLKRDIAGISDTYDMIVMFGLDSHLKNTVRIERFAECGGVKRKSEIDCDLMGRYLKASGIQSVVSETPANYLCNAAYYHMLHKVNGKAIFLHIPSIKNMSEAMLEKIAVCLKHIEALDWENSYK